MRSPQIVVSNSIDFFLELPGPAAARGWAAPRDTALIHALWLSPDIRVYPCRGVHKPSYASTAPCLQSAETSGRQGAVLTRNPGANHPAAAAG